MTTINLQVDLDPEFFDDIATTAAEGGINYWAHTRATRDPDTGLYTYRLQEMDDDPTREAWNEWITLTPELLALGAELLLRGTVPVNYATRADISNAIREHDASFIDAAAADCIVQAAIFNEVRYG